MISYDEFLFEFHQLTVSSTENVLNSTISITSEDKKRRKKRKIFAKILEKFACGKKKPVLMDECPDFSKYLKVEEVNSMDSTSSEWKVLCYL